MTLTQHGNPDFATLLGVVVAIGSVAGGLLLEGGSIRDIAQVTAALMVLGGTCGAVLISTPFSTLSRAARGLKLLFFERPATLNQILDDIVRFSIKSRKTGIASLEPDALSSEDPFMRKALNLAVDNTPPEIIRAMMEVDLDLEELHHDAEAKVFETAGGYAPTVGIIGAVLGLIQVMKHLENIDEVGRGIAVSFVATVYGVALANLILLPIAAKLRARYAQLAIARELTLEGVLAVADAMNTTLLKLKLEPYVSGPQAEMQRRETRPTPRPRAMSSAA